MSDLSFDEFTESTSEQWLKLVQKELGDRTVDSLQWEVEEGVVVEPYSANTQTDFSMPFAPVAEQYQLISHSDAKEWNRLALDSLMGGTNALGVDCESLTPASLEVLLQGIEVAYISIHFVNMHDVHEWASAFALYCEAHAIDCAQLNGSFEMSKIDLPSNEMKKWLDQSRAIFKRFRVVTIDAVRVHEQGGSIVQELTWALAAGHSALTTCMESGLSIDEASACLQFNFSTGSSYFPQIAKLRAFRWMWKQIIEAYQPEHYCSVNTFIHASTSRYLQTAKDKQNNLLRATTQAMSAFIGGANCVNVWPYNAWSVSPDESALRWARNIQQLLLEESYFNQYKTVADGTYYIEALTGKFIEVAWKQFQELDRAPLDYKLFSQSVAEHAAKQLALLQEGKRILVGVNRYVNKTDNAVVDERAQTLSAPLEKA